jgi:enoyl-CoA hydratase
MLKCQTDRIALVTLDRPPANALDRAFFEELTALLARLEADARVEAVVLTGTGRFFSAGLDLFAVFASEGAEFDAFIRAFDVGFGALFAFPKPVVAAVNGHAIAGGAVLAACADLRLVADGEAKMGLTEILVGVPFPRRIFEILQFACGGPAFQELLYHGRTYGPAAACARRLADEDIGAPEFLPRARAAAEELASRAPSAFRLTKRALRQDALARIEAVPPGVDPVWDVWRSPATREAVAAYRERTLGAKRSG